MTRFLLALALGSSACAAAVQMSFDEDVDGLLSAEELEIGTDPMNPDSDDDGHLDGAEFFGGTNPLDAEDYPYHGGWPIDGSCRNDVESSGSGGEPGDVAEQFRLVSQHGDKVRLHDFCGQVVVLKRSAGWCGACRASEGSLVALYDQFKDRGFMAVTLILETDTRGETADVDFLTGWAEQYGASHAIVADEGYGNRFERDGGIPTYVLIGPGAEVVKVDEGMPSAEDIEALLPE
jgi:thiol-disulfide isomerase/thioredoxin